MNIKLIIHIHVRVSSNAENLVKIGPVPKADSSGANGDSWNQGTDSTSRVKFAVLEKTEAPKVPKRVGCGEEVSPAPRKTFRFLSSISEFLCIQKKEAEQYNKPIKFMAKPSI